MSGDVCDRLYCWDIHNRKTNSTVNTVLSLQGTQRLERLNGLISDAEKLFAENNFMDAKILFETCVVCLIASHSEYGSQVTNMLIDTLQTLCSCYEYLGIWNGCVDACDYVLSIDKNSVNSMISLRARAKVNKILLFELSISEKISHVCRLDLQCIP